MNDGLTKELAAALRDGTSLDEMLGIVRDYRDQGVTQTVAANVLDTLRASVSTEMEEDRILELMDFVHGFCSPHMKLY